MDKLDRTDAIILIILFVLAILAEISVDYLYPEDTLSYEVKQIRYYNQGRIISRTAAFVKLDVHAWSNTDNCRVIVTSSIPLIYNVRDNNIVIIPIPEVAQYNATIKVVCGQTVVFEKTIHIR